MGVEDVPALGKSRQQSDGQAAEDVDGEGAERKPFRARGAGDQAAQPEPRDRAEEAAGPDQQSVLKDEAPRVNGTAKV